jgi:septal ring factor EnvC (AmiA/AmiB activator)
VEGALVGSADISSMLDGLSTQIKDRERQLSVLESLISTRNLSTQIVPGGRPVTQGWISSYFGQRTDPFTGHLAYHKGLDFAGPAGSQVVAVASGVVTYAKERFGYGKTVEINHGNGYVTRYAHNQRLLVTAGDTIQKGQAISFPRKREPRAWATSSPRHCPKFLTPEVAPATAEFAGALLFFSLRPRA